MTPKQAIALLRLVHAVCPAQAIDKYTPDVWGELLADIALEDAQTAVRALGTRQPWISPADVIQAVREARTRRIDDIRMPAPSPGLCDNPRAYIAWVREWRAAVASGQEPPAVTSDTPRQALPHAAPQTEAAGD